MTHPSGDRHWMHRKPHLIRRGTEANSAKLGPDDIRRIKELAAAGVLPGRIASIFGVSRQTIWRVTRGDKQP